MVDSKYSPRVSTVLPFSPFPSLVDLSPIHGLVIFLIGAIWFFRDRLWSKEKSVQRPFGSRRTLAKGESRDLVKMAAGANKNCLILFGSQTGIAEDIASRLAKEGHSRFGLRTIACNLEDYDYGNLNLIPSNTIVMFILSTFGEGEPTDNAQDFYHFLTADDMTFEDGSSSLANLNYVSFGLGNSTYEHFNAVSVKIDTILERLGGHRVAPTGRGDDGEKTTEEDFLAWKDPMWSVLAKFMNLTEEKVTYEPVYAIVDRQDLNKGDASVFRGEPNQLQLRGVLKAPFNARNPFLAPITASSQLFKRGNGNAIHMEFDLQGSGLTYETGDHVSIMPVNAGTEPLEKTGRAPFPVPTTYDSIVRHKMEIGAPVSRQFIQELTEYAPSPVARKEMQKLGAEKDYFHEQIIQRQLNLAQTLHMVSKGMPWKKVPFTMLLERILSLQPRFYSISSSPLVGKSRFTITTKVETHPIANTSLTFNGVTTKYLCSLEQTWNNKRNKASASEYTDAFPNQFTRNQHPDIRVPMYIRPSTFRLPEDPKTAVIMVGPGTGVAPFRAFVQERAAQASSGMQVGISMLFYGCRSPSEFIYEKIWKEAERVLGDNFKMLTAFSRIDTNSKIYVQDMIRQTATEVDALLRAGASFYICGDATMAKDVTSVLTSIIAEQRGLLLAEASTIVKEMRSANKFQEDAWS